MNTGVESRKALRYPLSANVVFSWGEESGARQKAEGITRDISVEGTYVFSGVLPPEKAAIQMEVDLPSLREGASPLRIHIQGHVSRIEKDPRDPVHDGFAVTSESTVLRGGESEN
jgi:hypothetical protein